MRKVSILLSLVLGMALILAACVPAETNLDTNSNAAGPAGDENVLEDLDEAFETITPELQNDVTTPGPNQGAAPVATAIAQTPLPGATDQAQTTPEAGEADLGNIPTAISGAAEAGDEVLPGTGETGQGETMQARSNFIRTAEVLRNAEVIGEQGMQYGTVEDFIVDLSEAHIDWVVLAMMDAQGTNQHVLVPWSAFDLERAATGVADQKDTGATQNFHVSNTVDQEMLNNAPTIDLTTLDLNASDWDAQHRSYWEDQLGSIDRPQDSSDNQGADLQNATGLNGMMRASDMLGMSLTGANESNLGSISDLLINRQTGRIQFAVISIEGQENQVIPIPLQVLEMDLEGTGFALPTGMETLEMIPSINLDDFNSLVQQNGMDWETDIQLFWDNLLHPSGTPANP